MCVCVYWVYIYILKIVNFHDNCQVFFLSFWFSLFSTDSSVWVVPQRCGKGIHTCERSISLVKITRYLTPCWDILSLLYMLLWSSSKCASWWVILADHTHVRQVRLENEVVGEQLRQLEFDVLHVGDSHDSQQYTIQEGLLYFQAPKTKCGLHPLKQIKLYV